ncbi:MAG TPA: SpoIIE family protein phosphatase [Acidimicrobiales bacterium]|nr:SpoIIE family protein phosphatase [Acidimicrobiales bacterium]
MAAPADPSTRVDDPRLAARARRQVADQVEALGWGELAADAQLVVSELVTNAVLHGGGCTGVEVNPIPRGIRVEVSDAKRQAPVLGFASPSSMTGRGLRMAASVASAMGVETAGAGKVIWAEITLDPPMLEGGSLDEEELLVRWSEDLGPSRPGRPRHHLVLGEVPTDLLVGAKSHVDNLVREFTLAASGARSGMSGEVVPHLASLIEVVVNRFSEARDSIKRQALAAAAAGRSHTVLELDLDAHAADAGEEYLIALDSVDAYCRAARLLTLETPPQHRVFRHWYVEELIGQLRTLARGETPGPVMPFEKRLIQEMEEVAKARHVAERSARLYTVAGALVAADSPEAVAEAVLNQGVAALGASGGGMLLASDADRLLVPGTVGYDQPVVERLRSESRDAELPAAVALRTGEAVWIESRAERNRRFPDLAALEPATLSACAVPLVIRNRCLGALRFSFNEPRLFDEDERRFVLALAAQAAQALARAQFQLARIEASERLQRSLLPPRLPAIAGVEVAAVYHPFGDGMEVGGDFYDLWRSANGQYGLAIGDVVGTGPEAAATTAMVRYSLRALTLHRVDAPGALPLLNEGLVSASAERDVDEVFCTAIVGRLQTAEEGVHLTLAGGGHPDPFIRRANGDLEEVRVRGSMLGAFPDIEVGVAEVALLCGDMLVMFTDGMLEARSPEGEMFGDRGIRRVLAACPGSAQLTADALEAAVVAHVAGELVDDLAVLILQVDPGSEPGSASKSH